MPEGHEWHIIGRLELAGNPPESRQTYAYCPRCGTVRAQLEQHGEHVTAPDYSRVGGTGQAEYDEPSCGCWEPG